MKLTMVTPDLTLIDFILVNTSAGKDSQAMLDVIVKMAIEQGVLDRVIAVHCDLGRAEWSGVAELAQEQCDHYGIPLRIVKRPQGDLVEQIRKRGMFPSPKARYCTSEQKRGQVYKVLTALVRESGIKGRRVRILNCMGLRIDEGKARKARLTKLFEATGGYFEPAKGKASNGLREVIDFYPIADWSEEAVWDRIRETGVRYHEAYDLGMPRLSCVFCIFAPKSALIIAGKANPELLAEYIELEAEIDHTFKHNFSLVEVAEAIERGDEIKPEAWGSGA